MSSGATTWGGVVYPILTVQRRHAGTAGAGPQIDRTETMGNEADACRAYVVPRLQAAGWDTAPHAMLSQYVFTAGRIIATGKTPHRLPAKRADYLLRYTPDFPIAVVEAKAAYKLPSDGLQQAKDYAEILGLPFAYATNGEGIVEFDYCTGYERALSAFPSPAELWSRLRTDQDLAPEAAAQLLTPVNRQSGKRLRYYQELAVNRAVQAIVQGQRRLLLTMATGTGKTFVAFQICWKLWRAEWNRHGLPQHPRVLYLADRNFLIDRPKDTDFAAFGDATFKIGQAGIVQSRELYFATYQSLARDEWHPGRYREYAPDFFDLVIVDECHRGSAREEGSWREILEYFAPAAQLGMTATPLRSDNVDTYTYFGDPIYTYSLRQGIEDGFLAPYRVHRVISVWDAAGWRPSQDALDRYGREIPERGYETADFERVVALLARSQAIARHLTEYLKQTDRFAKTIVFCVDQEHADVMRRELANGNADLMRQYPDYVCRVTADEGAIGHGHLGRFQDVETRTPTILTTSQLLTTGVDAPMCRNVVLARVIGSMTEFKQIIGRGTRVREDLGKLSFTIIDYTGATRLFADPAFDGTPEGETEGTIGPSPGEEPGAAAGGRWAAAAARRRARRAPEILLRRRPGRDCPPPCLRPGTGWRPASRHTLHGLHRRKGADPVPLGGGNDRAVAGPGPPRDVNRATRRTGDRLQHGRRSDGTA